MRSSRLTAVVGVAIAALLLGGCGGSDDAPAHNAADVAFAARMVPHHEQALHMVDMTEGRDLSPEFAHLTEHIEAAQTPEIAEMAGWLDDWDESVDAAYGPMMGAGMMGGAAVVGPGMMGGVRLGRLGRSASAAFEDMWLRMMIIHHRGAIEMAQAELDEGEFRPALDLARSIVSTQRAEIRQMRDMLGA